MMRVASLRSMVLAVVPILLVSSVGFALHTPSPTSVKVFIQKLPDPSNPDGPGLPVDHSYFTAAKATFVDDKPGCIVVELPANAAAGLQTALAGLVRYVEVRNDFDLLAFRINPQDARQSPRAVPAGWSRQTPLPDPTRDLWVIQFASTPRKEWLDAISRNGGVIVDYIPQNGYTVFASASTMQEVAATLPVQVVELHQPIHKIEPELLNNGQAFTVIQVAVLDVPENADVLSFLEANAAVPTELGQNQEQRHVYYAAFPNASLPELASFPTVQWIEARHPFVLSGEREAKLAAGGPMVRHLSDSGGDVLAPVLPTTGYRSWLTGNTNIFDYASKAKIAILDTGFDLNSLSSTVIHQDFEIAPFPSTPITIANYTSNDPSGSNTDCVGHGTLVAGTITGNAGDPAATTQKDNGSDGAYFEGLGAAPEIPVVAGRVFNYLSGSPTCLFDGVTNRLCPEQPWSTIFTDLLAKNVVITNASWQEGAVGGTAYTTTSHDFDLLVRHANGNDTGAPMNIYVSAGNTDEQPSGTTIVAAPATAKNIVAVGASENYNLSTFTPFDTKTAGVNSDRGNDIWLASRRGPTTGDSRIKPDIVAPGSAIEGPKSQGIPSDPINCSTFGPVLSDIDSVGTPARQKHGWSRGTSFASPIAAAEGAFLYTWFKHLNSSTGFAPSPAMLKAMQINLAYDMPHNTSANNATNFGHPPDNYQGWGKVDLGRAFQTGDYQWWDQDNTKILTPLTTTIDLPSGLGNFTIKNTSKDVRVTVVWTDKAAAANATHALVNDINVAVRNRNNGNYVLGNDFAASNPSSPDRRCIVHTSGGTIDHANNVEELVFTSADIGSTTFYVELTQSGINGDGLRPWTGNTPEQDFAIFLENVVGNP